MNMRVCILLNNLYPFLCFTTHVQEKSVKFPSFDLVIHVTQQTQNICITFAQCQPSYEEAFAGVLIAMFFDLQTR